MDTKHPETWSLLGNLHMAKKEFGPAQKKFERILKNPSQKDTFDAYSYVALANVWLQTAQQSKTSREKKDLHMQRALDLLAKVLRHDPNNIWAANGVGVVVASKG